MLQGKYKYVSIVLKRNPLTILLGLGYQRHFTDTGIYDITKVSILDNKAICSETLRSTRASKLICVLCIVVICELMFSQARRDSISSRCISRSSAFAAKVDRSLS